MEADKKEFLGCFDIIDPSLLAQLFSNSFKPYQESNDQKESYIFNTEEKTLYIVLKNDTLKKHETTCEFFQVKTYEIGNIEEFKELIKGKRVYKIKFAGLNEICVKLSKKQIEKFTLFIEMDNSDTREAVLISEKAMRTTDISETIAPIRMVVAMVAHPFKYFFLPLTAFTAILLTLVNSQESSNPLPISTIQLCSHAMQAIGETGRTECRINGNRVVYRWYDPQRGVWGRWRDHQCDERITYSYNSASGNLSFNTSYPEC